MRTQFCIWLVNLLIERELTRQEINEAWRKSYYYDFKEISRNTFLEYKRKAENLFDINIVCNRRTNKYYIENMELLRTNPLKKWLLSSMSAITTMEQCKVLSNRIMLEQTFGGETLLPIVTEAMTSGLSLVVSYKPFWYDESYQLVIDPYFVRLFKQRWYLIGSSHKHNAIRTFAFDRICDINISKDKFIMPEGLNVESYFSDSFGIMQQDNVQMETIRLKFIAEQGIYIETRPLHHSQKLISRTNEYMVFEFNLKPTFDFFQELMSYGSDLEVLSPQSLREKITDCVRVMFEIYDK
ncbi:WYL domain-containing protein [Bacteroides sp.]|uniref:WYL domain-containing protein n=1 Tax=Bacteroides sp. TaxID=29523 RepID=UPI00258E2FEB|nr:WYL domain-containing protein [Bacteroides sp.]